MPPSPAAEGGIGTATVASVAALSTWASVVHARLGAVVMDVATGAVLAAENEHRTENPASNTKILTAATVLDLLGPDYRFTTGLFGHVEGDGIAELVLRGNGDPSFSQTELGALVSDLTALGVKRVGGLFVDQSYFDDAFVPPAFEQQPKEWAPFRAPVSAVAFERNAVTLNVLPERAGGPALTWFEPAGFVDVKGAVTTRPAGAGNGVRITVTPSGSRLAATIGGFIGAGTPRLKIGKRVDDPRLLAGFALIAELRRRGIDVRGEPALGGGDVRERLASLDSAPLSVLVRELGKNSDNFYAETLLKALGGATTGAPSHTKAGADALLSRLSTVSRLDPGTRITNGSGLFDANRLSPLELANALRDAITNPRIGPDFVAQLAIGGVDGTLRKRFRAEASRRIVRAKTGTLNTVIALSGYVLAPAGKLPLCFSFILSDVAGRHAEARSRIDRTVETIAASLWRAHSELRHP